MDMNIGPVAGLTNGLRQVLTAANTDYAVPIPVDDGRPTTNEEAA